MKEEKEMPGNDSQNYKKRIKFVLEEASKQGADFFFLSEDIVQVKKSYFREAGSYTYWLGAKDDYSRVKITNRTYEKKDKYINAYKFHLIRIIPEEAEGALWQGFRDCLEGCADCFGRSIMYECNYCRNFVLEEYLKKGCDPNEIDYLGVPNLYRFFNCILERPEHLHISSYIYYLETDYTKLKILLDAGTDPNILPSKIEKERKYSIPDILMEVNPPYPSLLKLVKDKIKERKLEIEILHDKNKKDYEVTKAHLDFLIKIENLLVEYGARE